MILYMFNYTSILELLVFGLYRHVLGYFPCCYDNNKSHLFVNFLQNFSQSYIYIRTYMYKSIYLCKDCFVLLFCFCFFISLFLFCFFLFSKNKLRPSKGKKYSSIMAYILVSYSQTIPV